MTNVQQACYLWVLRQMLQFLGQFRRRVLPGVDVRVGGKKVVVVGPSQHHGHQRVEHQVVQLLRGVVVANGVLEGQVEQVLVRRGSQTGILVHPILVLGIARFPALQPPAPAVHVDGGVLLQFVDVEKAIAARSAVGDEGHCDSPRHVRPVHQGLPDPVPRQEAGVVASPHDEAVVEQDVCVTAVVHGAVEDAVQGPVVHFVLGGGDEVGLGLEHDPGLRRVAGTQVAEELLSARNALHVDEHGVCGLHLQEGRGRG